MKTATLALWVLIVLLAAALAGCTSPDENQDNDGTTDGGSVDAGGDALQETEVRQAYTAFGGLSVAVNQECDDMVPSVAGPENVGGACFVILENSTRAVIEMFDATVDPVGGYLQFLTSAEERTGPSEYFCGTKTFVPPTGAHYVRVTIQDPAWGNIVCNDDPYMGSPTGGEIVVTFEHE